MIKVYQDKFLSETSKRGNCLNACVASILEINLHDIPSDEACTSSSDQFKHLDKFLKPSNLVTDIDCAGSKYEGYRIACGETIRGSRHAVVYYNDTLVHDPHFSNAGLLKVDYYIHIIEHDFEPIQMNKLIKYKVIAFLDKEIIDSFADTLYHKLKTIKSDVQFDVNHGDSLTSISFESQDLQPYYAFQIAKSAQIANLPSGCFSTVRRGNKVIVRVIH